MHMKWCGEQHIDFVLMCINGDSIFSRTIRLPFLTLGCMRLVIMRFECNLA